MTLRSPSPLSRLRRASPRGRLPAACLALLLLAAASLLFPPADAAPGEGAVRSLRITDRAGGLLRELAPDGRATPVALTDVAPAAVQALIATEDRRFYRHPGIDPLALLRAARDNLRHGRVVSGGSTLTMQAARTLRGQADRGWWDKLAEVHLALRLEVHRSKRDILTLWLNRVAFGNRTFGIAAAARLYFGKTAADLTTAEAAYLVGLPQSPSRYNPFRYPERARARQLRVLVAMEDAGVLSAEARRQAEALPLDLLPADHAFRAPHFTEQLLQAGGLDGLTELRTTLAPQLQASVEALVRGHMQRLRGSDVTNAAVVVLDNATGDVLAYVGSADFWDARAGGQNDGVRMLRQPGSALKPFTYAHALAAHRYTAASVLPDLPLQVPEAGGAFSPQNYDRRFHGPVPLRTALACSYNVPAVRLAREVGPAALLTTLRRAGFASLRHDAEHYGVGLTLGAGEVQLLELARAYASLARGGTLPPLRAAQWGRTASGDTLHHHAPPPTPTDLDAATAYLISDILRDPDARAPAFGRGGPLELPFPCAVKTGTSKDYRDNWTVGYTPRHTVAVWVGNFDGSPMKWVSGVTGAGPLFHAVMTALGPGGAFARPAGLVDAFVCPASGRRPGPACPGQRAELFLPGTAPTALCDVHLHVRLDRRTGLLADASTPAEAVEARLFTVYPPPYHDWMRENGLPLPPRVTPAEAAQHSEAARYSDRLRVLYPAPGAVFRLDPVLRAAYQQLHPRGTADADLFDAAWWIDGTRLPGGLHDAAWPLTPGTHQLELRAVTADGQTLRSRPRVVRVERGPATTAFLE